MTDQELYELNRAFYAGLFCHVGEVVAEAFHGAVAATPLTHDEQEALATDLVNRLTDGLAGIVHQGVTDIEAIEVAHETEGDPLADAAMRALLNADRNR